MLAINVRRAIVYLATGVFFFVAATAQLQGSSAADAFLKAGVACAAVVILGKMVVYIVDSAAKRPSAASDGKKGSDQSAVGSGQSAEGGGQSAEGGGQSAVGTVNGQ